MFLLLLSLMRNVFLVVVIEAAEVVVVAEVNGNFVTLQNFVQFLFHQINSGDQ